MSRIANLCQEIPERIKNIENNLNSCILKIPELETQYLVIKFVLFERPLADISIGCPYCLNARLRELTYRLW